MKILVPVKRVIDYNVKVRVKPDGSGVDLSKIQRIYVLFLALFMRSRYIWFVFVITMITVIFLLVLGLAGWTVSTLMSKGKHQDDITKELGNIFESLKFLTSSITALVKLLMKDSIASAKDEDFQPISSNVIDLLKVENKDHKEAAWLFV